MKKLSILLSILLSSGIIASSQAYNPVGIKYDESSLILATSAGTVIQADVTADGGNAIYKASSTTAGSIWFGPYTRLQAGNYLVQFRMKVSSNTSTSKICDIDVNGAAGTILRNSLAIAPANFRQSNEWQVFTLPIQVSDNLTNFEVRGLSYVSGITDLYLDYVLIIPGDPRGIYTSEYTVTGAGQLGVGTKSPAYKLDVNGTAGFSGSVRIQSPAQSNALIGNRNPLYLDAASYSHNSSAIVFTKGNNSIAEIATDFSANGGKDIYLQAAGGASNILLNPNNGTGNIGIGAANPQEKLHVNGNILTTQKFYVGSLYRTIGDVIQSDNQSHVMSFRNTTGVGNPLGGFDFGDVANVSWMRLVGGNVGIGTTTPSQKLSVNGTILAKRVKISTSAIDWPDYVFDTSYILQPLKQVETFIQTQKHLPGVPSASEIKKEGIDVAETQAVLLKKIEELTLYIIEQNKRIEEQNKKIGAQNQKVLDQEKRIRILENTPTTQ